MIRWEGEHGCVRWDGYETKIDMTGALSVPELDALIRMLQQARADRKDVPLPSDSSLPGGVAKGAPCASDRSDDELA